MQNVKIMLNYFISGKNKYYYLYSSKHSFLKSLGFQMQLYYINALSHENLTKARWRFQVSKYSSWKGISMEPLTDYKDLEAPNHYITYLHYLRNSSGIAQSLEENNRITRIVKHKQWTKKSWWIAGLVFSRYIFNHLYLP